MPFRVGTEAAKAELEAVLASKVFSRCPNLAKILRYTATMYLDGKQESIKEYSIAIEALGRPAGFDPKEDSVVRVEAVRLRQKLRKYYETDGADHAVVISLQAGNYTPQFLFKPEKKEGTSAGLLRSERPPKPEKDRTLQEKSWAAAGAEMPNGKGPIAVADSAVAIAKPPIRSLDRGTKWLITGALVITALGVAVVVKRALRPNAAQGTPMSNAYAGSSTADAVHVTASSERAVRIIAGLSGKDYIGASGKVWGPDRYYNGGNAIDEPQAYIARAPAPFLYRTAREGEFSYNIPLKPGKYELRLYFVETQYGPASSDGGGENSRVFSVNLNGKPLLSDFDIYSDAGGADIADERVFNDVSPAADGDLRLTFVKEISSPILNALEIVPSPLGETLPIRIIAQESPYMDSAGHIWKPDRYSRNGRLDIGIDKVQGTPDPALYAGERFGNFSYAIPVPEGRYDVTLYFAETHFGPDNVGGGGIGSRIFNVDCNGVALLQNFDIFKEAGGDNRAVSQTFHGLRPNAQGKLDLSFIPVKNYASVRAIQVVEESR